MPKRNFLFVPNIYYHVYNHGFDSKNLFNSKKDFERFYLKMLQISEDYKKYGFSIKAWCLMPNHFHILLFYSSQEDFDPITKFMHRLQGSYGKYYSKETGNKGYVFDGRFKVKAITDDNYMRTIVNYIQKNSEKHFGIPYKNRQRRSDIKIDGSYEIMMEDIENYIMEI